jgi:hypothetical protein
VKLFVDFRAAITMKETPVFVLNYQLYLTVFSVIICQLQYVVWFEHIHDIRGIYLHPVSLGMLLGFFDVILDQFYAINF